LWIVSLLTSLLKSSKNEKKSESFEWFCDAEKMFCKFRDVFITVLIFVHFNFNLKNQIKTDALSYTVTEIYIQLQVSEQWNLITY